jgi:hypothetical protein
MVWYDAMNCVSIYVVQVEELAGQLGEVHRLTRTAFDEKMEKEVTRLR